MFLRLLRDFNIFIKFFFTLLVLTALNVQILIFNNSIFHTVLEIIVKEIYDHYY